MLNNEINAAETTSQQIYNLKPDNRQKISQKHTEPITRPPFILLVEDNLIIREINLDFLASANFSVYTAGDYNETIAAYRNKHYDAIILDIGLPGKKSGIDVCKKIRELEQDSDTHTPIIAFTAFGESVKDDCYAAGVDDFATKPLSQEELIDLVCKWLPMNFLFDKEQENEKANKETRN